MATEVTLEELREYIDFLILEGAEERFLVTDDPVEKERLRRLKVLVKEAKERGLIK